MGMVDMLMLSGGLAHEPSPTAVILPVVGSPLILLIGSSLPMPVSLLVAGDVEDKAS